MTKEFKDGDIEESCRFCGWVASEPGTVTPKGKCPKCSATTIYTRIEIPEVVKPKPKKPKTAKKAA